MRRLIAAAAALVLVTGCAAGSHPKAHRSLHAAVYTDAAGHAYCRAPQPDSSAAGFWVWYVYVLTQPSSTVNVGSSQLSGGSWSPSSTVPGSLAATGRSVPLSASEQPEETLEDAAAVPADELVDENTTEAEAQTDEQVVDPPADPAGDNGGDSGGGDGGGDSGGGDGGGGDGGGGGD